jgi:hypothetical protein
VLCHYIGGKISFKYPARALLRILQGPVEEQLIVLDIILGLVNDGRSDMFNGLHSYFAVYNGELFKIQQLKLRVLTSIAGHGNVHWIVDELKVH